MTGLLVINTRCSSLKTKKQKIITHVHLHLLCKVLKLELVKGFSIAVLFVEVILVTREHTDLTFWYFPPYFLMYLLSDLQFFSSFFSPLCSYLFALCFYFSGCDERAEEVQGRRGQEAWPEQVTGGRTSHQATFHLSMWTPGAVNMYFFILFWCIMFLSCAYEFSHVHTHTHTHTHTHDLVASYLYLSEIWNSWVQTRELIFHNLLSIISELFHFACPLLQTKLVSFADFDSPKLYQGGKK